MEKYVIKPSLQFYVAYEITGNQHGKKEKNIKDEKGTRWGLMVLKAITKTNSMEGYKM